MFYVARTVRAWSIGLSESFSLLVLSMLITFSELRAFESTMGSDELESFQARELFVLAWAEQLAPTIEAERDARKRRFNLYVLFRGIALNSNANLYAHLRIIDKLCAAGWKKELVGSTKSKLRRLPIVRQSEILTEQGWLYH